jgi:hypothetical protein
VRSLIQSRRRGGSGSGQLARKRSLPEHRCPLPTPKLPASAPSATARCLGAHPGEARLPRVPDLTPPVRGARFGVPLSPTHQSTPGQSRGRKATDPRLLRVATP